MHADTDPPPPYEFEKPGAARMGQANNPISYHIYRSAGNYSIHLNDKEPLYVVETHTRNFSKPNLVVYTWGRTSGKELANYRNRERAGLCDVGSSLDSNDKMSTVWWSNETQDELSAMHYRFTAMLDFSSTAPGRAITNQRSRSFIWMHTSRYMLYDEETNTKVAIFHEHSDPTDLLKCGILEVLIPFSDESNITILTSFLAIYDRAARKSKSSISKH